MYKKILLFKYIKQYKINNIYFIKLNDNLTKKKIKNEKILTRFEKILTNEIFIFIPIQKNYKKKVYKILYILILLYFTLIFYIFINYFISHSI
jgi:hypothetical protein